MAALTQQCAITEQKEDAGETEMHHLQFSWTFYVFSCSANRDWEENMQKIATFSTVEHFWGLMSSIQPPSKIVKGTDLYVFREGIQPMWEDPKNKNGGRWLINVIEAEHLNRYWEELLMLIVGNSWETEQESEEICGAVFQPRSRGIKISLWTSDYKDEESIMRIGRRIKEVLEYPERLVYQTVSEQQNVPKGRDVAVGKYVI